MEKAIVFNKLLCSLNSLSSLSTTISSIFIFFFSWWKVKYKEQSKKEMKSHQYNPLDSASFKQAQIASTLASDVSEFALYFTCVCIPRNLPFILNQKFPFYKLLLWAQVSSV